MGHVCSCGDGRPRELALSEVEGSRPSESSAVARGTATQGNFVEGNTTQGSYQGIALAIPHAFDIRRPFRGCARSFYFLYTVGCGPFSKV